MAVAQPVSSRAYDRNVIGEAMTLTGGGGTV